ncbi:MAG: S-layer family protein, partial [Paucibacter sp.]|nr:S-layer family protein [Roseateles sp.]
HPLNISLGAYSWGSGAIAVTSVGDLNLTNGFGVGSGGLSLTAGGNITYSGGNISLYQAPVTMHATGSITGASSLEGASGVTMQAGQSINVAGIDDAAQGGESLGNGYGPASNPISLTAGAGSVTLNGSIISNASVNITAATNIYGQSGNFGLTPSISLQAGGDIGTLNGSTLGTWNLNGANVWYEFNYGAYANPGTQTTNPGVLTLNAVSTGGSVELGSYAGVNVARLSGANTVSLQVHGDYVSPNAGIVIGTDPTIGHTGTVSSATGSVTLTTADGNITGAAGNAVKAAGSITVQAHQSTYANNSGEYYGDSTGGTYSSVVYPNVYNIGYDGSTATPLALSAPVISLMANGSIYATLPVTGVSSISVGRTYAADGSNAGANWAGSLGALMPGGTVQIKDTNANTIVAITDTGATSGSSTVAVNYGTSLNFSYASYDPIQLGTVNLGSGALALAIANPFNVGITSANSSITGGQISFTLNPQYDYNTSTYDAAGGFGTANAPINTQVGSISGSTTGATAGFYVNQTGAITLNNLQTGGGIGVTASGNITLENTVSAGNGGLNLNAGTAQIIESGTPTISSNGGDVVMQAASIALPGSTVRANAGNVSLTATDALNLGGATVYSAGSAGMSLIGSTVALGNSQLSTTNGGGVSITATSGNIDLTSAQLNSSGDVSAMAQAITAPGSTLGSGGNLSLTASTGGLSLANSQLGSQGSIGTTLTATAGAIDLSSARISGGAPITVSGLTLGLGGTVMSSNGAINVQVGSGGLDLSTANIAGAEVIASSAQTLIIGAINGSNSVDLTSTTGAIQGNSNSTTGVTGQTVSLNAATGIGTAAPVLVYGGSGSTLTAQTTTGDVQLLAGGPGDHASSLTMNIGTGAGLIHVLNNYGTLEMGQVASGANGSNYLGNITVYNSVNNSTVQVNTVTASGPGAMVEITAPSGTIQDDDLGSGVSASRIVLNTLGLGGKIASANGSPSPLGVQVNGQAVVAVSSGDITLDSTATALTQMPLVASNGHAQTISITSAGDFQVGQLIAGLSGGTVNIDAAGNIAGNASTGTVIHAANVNLTATGNIGSASNAVATAAYDFGANQPGVITAHSTGTGDIYINQTGAVTLQSVTTNNGAIHVNVAGNTFVNLASSAATDAPGNDVNISLSQGDMTVNQAIAGATQGAVRLSAAAGSILGDALDSATGTMPRDCCTDPHVQGNAAHLVAQDNIGYNGTDSSNTLSVQVNQLSTSTSANNAYTVLYLLPQTAQGTVALGNGSLNFSATGTGSTIDLKACFGLDLTGMGDASAWTTLGTNAKLRFSAGTNLLLPNTLDTTTNPNVASLTLIGGSDV